MRNPAMNTRGLLTLILAATCALVFGPTASAADYFVSTTGSDAANGSQNAPFRTVIRALNAMDPGDFTYIMPGDYSNGSRLTIEGFHGVEGNLLHLFAFDNTRKPLFRSGIMIHNTSFVHFKGFDISEIMIQVDGVDTHHNTFENFDVHHVPDAMGMSLQNSANNNRVINSDFHHNVLFGDSNADGLALWGVSGGTNGPYDNYVYGCRAYFNNDDGFDTWWSNGENVFENCWSYGNGKDDGFNDILGDGNGYKLGQGSNNHPRLINCLAWKNKTRGFDENGNQAGGITIYNSTGWDNDVRNFGFFSAPNTDVIKNCVSFAGGGAQTPPEYATAEYNNWDLGITADA
ncbi:MAG: right-handed parallel beta-helix repeat-containing protein, partial [Candidatus Krumholzibacteria bacterium]|nr:right-handed parallel beta-helix repeat-containing protein [Candidatus Krumholzibacteria bacterium]